jgi:hypothetical protein
MMAERLLSAPLPGEHIVFYLRRHWFTFATVAVWYTVLFIVPLILAVVIANWFPELHERLFNGELTETIVRLTICLYYLGLWVFLWNAWVDYYLDVWLVTNERVLSLEQRGLFNRVVAELRLSRVQDVASNVKGFWPTILHYGDVRVQTAGEMPNFDLKEVPRPYEVAEKILRLADTWRHEHPNENP